MVGLGGLRGVAGFGFGLAGRCFDSCWTLDFLPTDLLGAGRGSTWNVRLSSLIILGEYPAISSRSIPVNISISLVTPYLVEVEAMLSDTLKSG